MQNQARKTGQKNRKTKNEPPQSRKVGDTESQLGHWAKEVPVCPPARPPSEYSGEDMARPGSVTEWVSAGQQTAICKHHEGKHQSTLDFFYIIFLLL